ncbi:cell division protein FtsQ/DivIB [Alkalibacterium kapii]|uniref:Cell division protein DivIB n=1 Tax=Alkalibacterium kapii TaxID=426704 RepID=A0A511AWP7_9LACT|nr:cell division protein FtsQ/DivIB [Alkalibacterium kapii]GEK91531.1 hypothetical protein AKA01nite_11530 [Alkalibacterium kapii]
MGKNKKEYKKTEKSPESSVIYLKNNKNRFLKWGLLVTLFTLILLISVYFISPYRLVENIYVTGANEVYDQKILDSSGLKSGESIWEYYFDKSEIEEQVMNSDPQIKNVELSLSGLQDYTLAVEEYETVAYLTEEDKYKKILENGDILTASTANMDAEYPILHDFKKGRVLEQFLEEYKQVDKKVKDQISEIEYMKNKPGKRLIYIFMNDGNEVLVTVPDFSERLNYYQEMKGAVDKRKGLFDLEAGAYFKPFSDEEENEEKNNE